MTKQHNCLAAISSKIISNKWSTNSLA